MHIWSQLNSRCESSWESFLDVILSLLNVYLKTYDFKSKSISFKFGLDLIKNWFQIEISSDLMSTVRV